MKSVKSYNDIHVKKNKDYIISKQLIIVKGTENYTRITCYIVDKIIKRLLF
jgi:hypothetical protein